MPLSGAEKVRRYPARRRAGEAVLPIKVDLHTTADWLIDHGKLAEWDAGDRNKVRSALEDAVRFWSRYETS